MYEFIPYQCEESHQYSDEAVIQLQELIAECDFIKCNFGLFDIVDIKGTEDSHRGVAISFTDGQMTYGYNVEGGYKKYKNK